MADTTIADTVPSNSNTSGASLYVGQTGTAGVRRSFVRWNLASATGCNDHTPNSVNDCVIPAGSTVTQVDVIFRLTRSPNATAQTFWLHRVTQAWSATGTSTAPDPNGGALVAATVGDTTWNSRNYNTLSWSTPGGTFSATVSATETFTAVAADATVDVTFDSTDQLIADVQGWINSPSSNNGWVMLGAEGGEQTAFQFASRENPEEGHRPRLVLRYRAPQGAACSATAQCKAGLTCLDGVCCNVAVCTAASECHLPGTCQPGTGVCSNPTKPNGTACTDDGLICTSDVCQSGTCTHPANRNGVLCRASAGECDPAETCVNGNSACPTDAKSPNGTACTPDSNPCTLDQCNGVSAACQHPAGNAGAVCRAAAPGGCDVAETCTGSSATCPTNEFLDGTPCGAGPVCSGGQFTPQSFCNGSGASCPTQPTNACPSGAACSSPTACLGGCTTDADCASENDYCAAPTCVPKKPNGEACAGHNQCARGQCRDGVCCNNSCGNGVATDCRACNLPGKLGTCSTLPANTICRPSQGPCDPQEVCNGTSTACPNNVFEPATTECRAASCTSGTQTESASCTGSTAECPTSASVSCAPFSCGGTTCRTSCSADNHCAGGFFCSNGTCIAKYPNGLACAAANQCVSNRCVDGVCCNTPCTGQCEACDVNPGTCTAVTGNPRGDRPACAGDGTLCSGTCNGSNRTACTIPGTSVQCTPASCDDGIATLEAFCDGQGNCPADELRECAPFACGFSTCFADCKINSQCAPGFYCAGGFCEPRLPNGEACVQSAQCASGYCVDGVCCESACDGQCEYCAQTGAAGTCIPVLGTPQGGRAPCVDDGTLCGGSCDGLLRASCTYPPAGTPCRPGSCVDGTATLEATCTGTGLCPGSVTAPCDPFSCNSEGTRCAGDCARDDDCGFNEFCSAGVCREQHPVGSPCTTGRECNSSLCVDGFCCSEACSGQCEACDVAGSEGSCTPVPSGEGPHGGRPQCTSDGTACGGACDGANRQGCAYPGQETECREPSCANGTARLGASCIGSGRCPAIQEQVCPGACAGDLCAGDCVDDADCAEDEYCSAGVCLEDLDRGAACAANAQCKSGFCVDGFCCNQACTEQCYACDVPGQEGFCTPLAGAPHGGRNACGGSGPCAAACQGAASPTCRFPGQETACGVGSCSDGVASGLSVCNQAGSCLPPQTISCEPFTCNGPLCATACSSDDQCADGYTCVGITCMPITAPDGGVDGGSTSPDGSAGAGGGSSLPGSGGSANGGAPAADAGTDAGDAGPGGHGKGDSGCGCRTAGRTSSGAAIGLSCLALALAMRRRRDLHPRR